MERLVLIVKFPHSDWQQVLLPSDSNELFFALFHLQGTLQEQVLQIADFFAEEGVFVGDMRESVILWLKDHVVVVQIIDNKAELVFLPVEGGLVEIDLIF